jgi:antitoxin component YwqK of YwqJK toxin-antitoxin module
MPIVKEYYENGALKAKGIMRNELKEGKWISYFESGELESEISYANDVKNGEFKRWYKNGNLAVACFYVDGKQDGFWKEYYENGMITVVGEFKNGTGITIEKFGHLELDVYEQYFENGVFIREIKMSSAQYGSGFKPLE